MISSNSHFLRVIIEKIGLVFESRFADCAAQSGGNSCIAAIAYCCTVKSKTVDSPAGWHSEITQRKSAYRFTQLQILKTGSKMKKPYLAAMLLFTTLALNAVNVNALSTDKNEPAVISADDVEFDFSTGVRIYRGNVKLDQGTMKLRADKLIVEYKDDVLQKATAFGQPAVFQQRPDDKPNDVIGKGMKLELDEVNNMVILIDNASLNDGEKNAAGAMITYDMANDKMKIVGAGPSGAVLKQAAKPDKSAPVKTQDGRSKITISAKERKQAQDDKEE